jgi:hypothetical protein
MTWANPDELHRTAKGLIDSGRASTPDEARRVLESLILQVTVGAGLGHDPAAQAALATIVNAGQRAFLGGVNVHLEDDPPLSTGWTAGMTATEAVRRLGGRVVGHLAGDRPTLAVARPADAVGSLVLHATCSGWTGGVVESAQQLLRGDAITPAGVVAGALGVSEIFQHSLGAVVPGRREVGISLWRPDLSWRSQDAVGETLQWLPAKLWLLGLGHLGQGYAWTIGMLPYATPGDVQLSLVDFDHIIQGNTATQLLVTGQHIGLRKTRVVAYALEKLGFETAIVERAFDEHFYPARDEPTIALAGFDRPEPRRQLGGDRFSRVVDTGLGAGHVEYLDILLHTFPSPEDPATAFPARTTTARSLPAAYESEINRQVEEGVEEGVARCGMLEIAGVTVGAAFVGAFAGALAVADVLRLLHGGEEFSVIGIDLRTPSDPRAVTNSAVGSYAAPAYTPARCATV